VATVIALIAGGWHSASIQQLAAIDTMAWLIGSAEFLAGLLCVAAGVLIVWAAGPGTATLNRIAVLPLIVLLLLLVGFTTILHAAGML
jgi:hypothetical protein